MLNVSIREISIKNTLQEKILLQNIQFSLPENKIYTIVGKNGTGKTTLLKSLTKLLADKYYNIKGEVYLNGTNLLSLNPKELNKIREEKIKYALQDASNCFDPLKNFSFYFKKFVKEQNDIDEYLYYFQLPNQKNLFKLHPYEISGGMNQRVSIVLSFLSKPEIIILDEPNSAVDPSITNLLIYKLKEFAAKNNNSVLLITQDLPLAEKISDKIAYLGSKTLTPFVETSEFYQIENEEIKQFIEPALKLSYHE
jgi:peptide/nickel transport system ATP-binding protein